MIVELFQNYLDNDRIPNLLLVGPHGCAKSTLARILAHEYLGNHFKKYCMEIIGSIFRGKNVVSKEPSKKKASDSADEVPNISEFLSKRCFMPDNKCRIIIIYDFDCMTTEAQMALRRTMEISPRVSFIFVCNNIGKIIEAIQSRTSLLKFQQIGLDEIIQRVKEITASKQLLLGDDIYEAISIMSNCDMKQAINCLQVFSNSTEHKIEDFYHIFNIPSIKCINDFIRFCFKNMPKQAFEILDKLVADGYNVTDILEVMIKVLIYDKNIKNTERIVMIEETNQIMLINEQASSVLHLYRLAVTLLKLGAKPHRSPQCLVPIEIPAKENCIHDHIRAPPRRGHIFWSSLSIPRIK